MIPRRSKNVRVPNGVPPTVGPRLHAFFGGGIVSQRRRSDARSYLLREDRRTRKGCDADNATPPPVRASAGRVPASSSSAPVQPGQPSTIGARSTGDQFDSVSASSLSKEQLWKRGRRSFAQGWLPAMILAGGPTPSAGRGAHDQATLTCELANAPSRSGRSVTWGCGRCSPLRSRRCAWPSGSPSRRSAPRSRRPCARGWGCD